MMSLPGVNPCKQSLAHSLRPDAGTVSGCANGEFILVWAAESDQSVIST